MSCFSCKTHKPSQLGGCCLRVFTGAGTSSPTGKPLSMQWGIHSFGAWCCCIFLTLALGNESFLDPYHWYSPLVRWDLCVASWIGFHLFITSVIYMLTNYWCMSVRTQIWIFNSYSLLVVLFDLLTGHVKMVLPTDTTPQMLVAKPIVEVQCQWARGLCKHYVIREFPGCM
jgi:hypothetical protein